MNVATLFVGRHSPRVLTEAMAAGGAEAKDITNNNRHAIQIVSK